MPRYLLASLKPKFVRISEDLLTEKANKSGLQMAPAVKQDAFMAWPLWLGARFRHQPRAPSGAPLRASGGAAQRGQASGAPDSNVSAARCRFLVSRW